MGGEHEEDRWLRHGEGYVSVERLFVNGAYSIDVQVSKVMDEFEYEHQNASAHDVMRGPE